MAYIGNSAANQTFTPVIDTFNGNGSTTAFTLTYPVASVAQVEAYISNVPQQPGVAYTVLGNTITFTSAPPSGTANIYVRYTSPITQIMQPGAGTVGLPQLATNIQDALFGNFRNRIINGAMMIDQRNAGASVTVTSAGQYPVDRFLCAKDTAGATVTAQQSTTAPSGFTNSLLWTTSTGSSPAATDENLIWHKIEGFNVADFAWGTASAQTIAVSFQVRCSLTGTFGVTFRNSANNRTYVASFVINSANTFESKTVVIPGDTSGTWLTNNGVGLFVTFDMGAGTSKSGSAGSWSSNAYVGLTGGVKMVANTGATFYITGVQLEKGSTATSFDYRPYGTELSLCKRYLPYLSGNGNAGIGSGYTGSLALMYFKFPVTTRVPPTGITISSPSGFYVGTSAGTATTNLQFNGATTESSILIATVASGLAAGQSQVFGFPSGQYIYWNGCEL